MKRYFKCEMKTAVRWQQLAVSEILTEPNHLNGWFIQEQSTVMCCSETQNSAAAVFGSIFVGDIEQK